MLKLALIKAPIHQSPNWDLPFEIMCDASDYAVGAVLGQRIDKKPTAIWYASKTLAEAQMNYMTRRDREVIDFTRYRVKNNTKLTNLMKMNRIQGYNGKYRSNP